MIKNITAYLLATCFLLSSGLISCKKTDEDPHNSSSPVVVNRFYPISGGAGTEVLITGKNFTNDTSKVSVTIGGKPLKVISCNSNGIMVVVPKKCGSGLLEINIDGSKPVTSVEEFTYTFSATVTTLAGNGKPGFADGQGTEAQFYLHDTSRAWRKGSICVDDDLNVYVGDAGNFCIRKITPDGTVSLFAGRAGMEGYTDGTGTAARFREIYGMDCDAQGNIYVVDVAQWSVRKVTPDGEVSTLCNTSFEPWCIGVDKRNGTLYVTNPNGSGGIWQLKSGESSMTQVVSGVGISDVVVDNNGNLYATEFNSNQVAKYEANTWNRTLVAGSSQGYADGAFGSAQFSVPWGIVMDRTSGDLYVAGNGIWDGSNNADQSIRRLDMAAGVVRTVAGSGSAGYTDANGTNAAFSAPLDLAIDKNGVIYVYDRRNNVIRKIVYE